MTKPHEDVKLSLLKPAQNTAAFLKMGLFGDTGSGKTWTASQVAIGLHKHIKSDKPVAFFDTETGSSFVKPEFDKAGIDFFTVKSHAVTDLVQTLKEAEANCSVLIIDSISHVWEEFTDSYLKKARGGFIEIQDWKPIKSKFRATFTNFFLSSNLHVIMCGRESAIYKDIEIVRGGKIKYQMVRVGDKMKAEADMGYESHVLCQMKKVYLEDGGKYVRRLHVIKERYNIIDSKSFDNPKFKDFLPHVNSLNLGGIHEGTDTSRSSEELFDEPNNTWDKRKKEIEIVLEHIKNEFIKAGLDGTGADAKKVRIAAMEKIFKTNSWKEIETMRLEKLQSGLKLTQELDLIEFRENFKTTH